MKIYLASSWRNQRQPAVLAALRAAGHDVYDFRNPAPGDNGFSWSEIAEHWIDWTPAEFIRALEHPVAHRGFSFDMNALRWCDACVLLLPCGRSAHLELGWACGAGKLTVVLVEEILPEPRIHQERFASTQARGWEPELMYKMCDLITDSLDVAIARLRLWSEQGNDCGEAMFAHHDRS